MFYFKEFFLRIQYFSLSFFTICCLFYYYKNLLLIIITSSLLYSTNKQFSAYFSSFIYTHPAELLNIYFNLILIFAMCSLMPYIVWQILDFFKSSLYKLEYKKFCNIAIILFCYFASTNLVCFFKLFPNIWNFFELFNDSTNKINILTFFFELRIQEYFNFIINFIYIINATIFFFLILFIFVYFWGIKKIIYWKKLFIFINIMFATLLSPPDVYSQIAILIVLTFLFELTIFSFFINLKLKKYV